MYSHQIPTYILYLLSEVQQVEVQIMAFDVLGNIVYYCKVWITLMLSVWWPGVMFVELWGKLTQTHLICREMSLISTKVNNEEANTVLVQMQSLFYLSIYPQMISPNTACDNSSFF